MSAHPGVVQRRIDIEWKEAEQHRDGGKTCRLARGGNEKPERDGDFTKPAELV